MPFHIAVAVEIRYGLPRTIENDPKYWEVLSSALAVGWLDIVVSMTAKLSMQLQVARKLVRFCFALAGYKIMYNLAWKCRIKPISSSPKLMNLVLEIFGENAEVVAEWSRLFGPWK
nr:nuclear pore complex protein NUP85 [Ipomoea batatas]